ncbi:methyltransferase domain-containing protein [Saccharopolyspora sp. NFXS83]|uniref:class I SAM-dependent methyltransferase n=1 Tax=Saccharopolyspora sp. NFXS83 TaxID=2993560 RepID=UPI00224A7253|nr:methyltransferase domain-containing protein [Saccharopolyspora sp. NFXS83]MCX2729637.1 methyltransferase domain-containing protein [Saccharopolyspora sp. NFXS83]
MTGAYVFDVRHAHEEDWHRCLSAAHDPLTLARLAKTGVGAGWHCLEVGAGAGDVSVWLANRVAPTGSVLTTDLQPMLESRGNLLVREHDVVTDPLPEESFDLVVARLVLRHLPQRQSVLAKLVRSLKPGGWLQIDEFDTSYEPLLLAADEESALLYEKFLAAKAAVMRSAGVDEEWGRRVPLAMRRAGLVDVDPRPHVQLRHRGSADLRLLVHRLDHLWDRLLATGMTEAELVRVRAVMLHPEFRATSSLMYSVHGRKVGR